MNCCGGEESHKQGVDEKSFIQHGPKGAGLGWLQIGALLLVFVLVAGVLLAFLK